MPSDSKVKKHPPTPTEGKFFTRYVMNVVGIIMIFSDLLSDVKFEEVL